MPDRIRRDWTDSWHVEPLTADDERLYSRLHMKADPLGRFSADPRLIKSQCFPLIPTIRETDISRWLAACEKAGLLVFYEVDGRKFLAIVEYKQRLRLKKPTHPAPPGAPWNWEPSFAHPIYDGHMPDTCQTNDSHMSLEGNGREEEGKGDAPDSPPPPRGLFTPEDVARIANAYPLKTGLKGAHNSIRDVLMEILPKHNSHAEAVEWLLGRVAAFAASHAGQTTSKSARWWFVDGHYNDPDEAWTPRKVAEKPAAAPERPAFDDAPLSAAELEDRRRYHERLEAEEGVNNAGS